MMQEGVIPSTSSFQIIYNNEFFLDQAEALLPYSRKSQEAAIKSMNHMAVIHLR